jgi:phospholipid/cholesterol/gamma-HCH transport system substrate-binding protein
MQLNNEVKIGILVVAVSVILFGITWKAGNFDFRPEGYEIKVLFKNIDGVEANSPVTLNGFEMGRVKNINIIYGDETWVELTLWLEQEAKVPVGAEAFVKNMGFLGEKYVGITTGEGVQEFLPAGSTIKGREPGSFEKILSEGEVIAKNIKEISVELNERLKVNSEAIDDIIGDLRVSMKNIASISNNVDERLKVNEGNIDEMLVNLNSATKNFDEMSADLKVNPWKLMYKPKQYRNY